MNFRKSVFLLMLLASMVQLAIAQSPFGTGQIDDQDIGVLNDRSVIFPSNSGWGTTGFYPDMDTLLKDYVYDLYIPTDYDSTEPYGLVTYINSGNNAPIRNS